LIKYRIPFDRRDFLFLIPAIVFHSIVCCVAITSSVGILLSYLLEFFFYKHFKSRITRERIYPLWHYLLLCFFLFCVFNFTNVRIEIINPSKALNKAYFKQSLKREQIETFKTQLIRLFERINEKESEEHLKNIVSDFLKDSYYKCT